MNTYTLEQAQEKELEICSRIINEGRGFQREQGFVQWTDDYPNRDTVIDDIKKKKGYVIKADGKIAGYMFVDFGKDPDYDHIRGEWRTAEPYAVVHRMAFAGEFRGRGLSEITFRLISDLCISKGMKSIRMDTDFPNKRMQHVLEKNGFQNCGIIIFQGGEKMAYEKAL